MCTLKALGNVEKHSQEEFRSTSITADEKLTSTEQIGRREDAGTMEDMQTNGGHKVMTHAPLLLVTPSTFWSPQL